MSDKVTLTVTSEAADVILRALQVMATEPTEPEKERRAYAAALAEVGESLRP